MRPAAIAGAIAIRPAVLGRWLKVLETRGLIWSAEEAGEAPAPVSLTNEGMALALRCIGGA